jgi:hypothetical protein
MAERSLDIVARFTAETRGMETATRDVERDLGRLDAAYDKAGRSAKDWSRDTDRAAKDAGDGIRNTGREVGAEFAENVGEAFRSGDLAGTLTETLTSLAPALGAVGIGVGIGGAIIGGAIGAIQKRNADVKAAAVQSFDAFADGVLEAAERQNVLQTAMGYEDAQSMWEGIAAKAREANVPVAEYWDYVTSAGRVAGPAIVARTKEVADWTSKANDRWQELSGAQLDTAGALNVMRGDAERVAGANARSRESLAAAAEVTKDIKPVVAFDQQNLNDATAALTAWSQLSSKQVRLYLDTSDFRRQLDNLLRTGRPG